MHLKPEKKKKKKNRGEDYLNLFNLSEPLEKHIKTNNNGQIETNINPIWTWPFVVKRNYGWVKPNKFMYNGLPWVH